ncbi:hypothetical protein BDZ94DRAFT_1003478 [Collybia nuda]|uniref:F-box domain-containing protein n=1 Tax=Collybia nuda TaxID=64659 RepID=A0A9P5Y1H9_9AGAR|nr:hypothetical protein BDZ94DRAFT_1003478 [Collybia nuda]
MVLSASIPPEIVHKILQYLQGDKDVLKNCSFVSDAFYQHTRKFLFASITLGQPKAVSSLRRTIARNPQIAGYIRSLNIPYPFKSTLREIMAIQPMLVNIHHLILGVNGHYTMIPDFSGFVPGITALLKLPRLEKLEIFSIEAFPASLFQVPRRLKWLTLDRFRIDPNNIPVLTPLPLLLTVHLMRIFPMESDNIVSFIHVPNLRHIILDSPGSTAQHFLETGAETIKDVVWCNYFGNPYPSIDLGVLRNLQRLSFVTTDDSHITHHYFYEYPPWVPMVDMLCSRSIYYHLEELNLVIKTNQALTSASISSLLGPTNIWDDFASTARYPRLRSFTIHLDISRSSSPINEADARRVIARGVPLLEETGHLRVVICKDFDWKDLLPK